MVKYSGGNKLFCDFSIMNGPGDVQSASCVDPDHLTDPNYNGVIRATGLPISSWVGGSFEGHRQFSTKAAEPWFLRASYTQPLQAQYAKTRFRCARPVVP